MSKTPEQPIKKLASHEPSAALLLDNTDSSNHNLPDDSESGVGSRTVTSTMTKDVDVACMRMSRRFVYAILVVLAAIAGAVTYIYKDQDEQDDFEAQATANAIAIVQFAHEKSQTILGVLHTLAGTLSLSAASSTTGTTSFPEFTFPNYEAVVEEYRALTGARSICMAPIVENNAARSSWQSYADSAQDWIDESYAHMGLTDVEPLDIPEVVYEFNEQGQRVQVTDEGPFSPLWQMSEPPLDTTSVNYNLASNEVFQDAFVSMMDKKAPVLSQTLDDELRSVLGETVSSASTKSSGPESLILEPIRSDARSTSSPQVATVLATLSWEKFLSGLLHDDSGKMVVVVSNGDCGEEFSYVIENDGSASFLGQGDFQDSEYSHLVEEGTVFTDHACPYRIQVSPSSSLEARFSTSTPGLYMGIMFLIFFLAGIVFFGYNYLVEKRQRKAALLNKHSDAIVSSLLPAEFRDRVFDNKKNGKDGGDGTGPHKYRLKNYLNEDDESDQDLETAAADGPGQLGKPIADLFPSTTIMFADISGFTAWSSVREPSQVFTLLETIYKAFDAHAKRRKVFKVETVGDCYVAVTGLPEPNEEHAIVMCKFARDCLDTFNELVKQLEIVLGPDTGDLALRTGLHSGPVTAGVLRGEKSRFQLFGDTMNTTARIETTGLAHKIHVSHECAEELHKGDKHHWIKKRDDTIMAKGKGEMQSYWLLSNEELANIEQNKDVGAVPAKQALLPIVKASAPRVAGSNVLDPESSLPPRIKRLVDWNVDVLKRLLKQVVAKRNATMNEQFDIQHPKMMAMEMNIGSDTYVLNEVKEIIELPEFNVEVHKRQENPNKIVLPKEVEDQLRLYVSSIAAMHRDNPFHNFEHASHVMMSVSKLLSRIVAPGEDEDDADLHDHTYGITSDPLTQFSVILAALIHDVDHAGVSNFQLIKEDAKIATVFKNKSVAEQNSIVLAWNRLMESRFVALRNTIYASPEELRRFRELMVNTVMATDIFDKELTALRKGRWEKAFAAEANGNQSFCSDTREDINRKATVVIEHLIQASDVAHTMQHWHIYQKWNERLFAEMTVAYQNGRMGNNPADGWYKGELGFFDNYIIPLAKKLKDCGVFGVSSDEYLNYALENRREWAIKGEEQVKKMIEKYAAKPDDEAGAEGTNERKDTAATDGPKQSRQRRLSIK